LDGNDAREGRKCVILEKKSTGLVAGRAVLILMCGKKRVLTSSVVIGEKTDSC